MRVIVIGGGIVGASCAYHAAVQGAEVVLVDDRRDGQATAAGAGIVCPWARADPDPDLYRLSVAAAAYYPQLVDRLAEDGYPDAGYRRVGSLHLADGSDGAGGGAAELAGLRDRLLARRRDAPQIGDVQVLPPGEPARLFPPLRAEVGAVHVAGAGRVDGRTLRDTLRSAATDRHGVAVEHGAAEVAVAHDRVSGVDVAGRRIGADAVIVAAGAWSTRLCGALGVPIPVEPQRGQIVHAVLPGQDTSAWPIVEPPGDHYLLAFPGSRVVFGATRETGSGFDVRMTVAGVASVLNKVLTVAPGLADATVTEVRVGLRPLSTDGLPVIGAVDSLQGLIVATGMGPTGLTLGPYSGQLAAQLAVRGAAETDLGAFDPCR